MAKTILEQCLKKVEEKKLKLQARLQGVSVEEMLQQKRKAEVLEFRRRVLDTLAAIRQQKGSRVNVAELAMQIAAIIKEEQPGKAGKGLAKIKIDDIQTIIDFHLEREIQLG